MRNTGIALTIVGGVVAIAGMALAASADSVGRGIPAEAFGIGMGIAGGVTVLTGIPLWAVGVARYEQKPASKATAGISLAIGATSAAVQGRF
jgi:hypothetical protein